MLPRLALFLQHLPSSTACVADLQRWTDSTEKLEAFLRKASPNELRTLLRSTDLTSLLCSSLAHGLQLLVAASTAAATRTAAAAASVPDHAAAPLWRIASSLLALAEHCIMQEDFSCCAVFTELFQSSGMLRALIAACPMLAAASSTSTQQQQQAGSNAGVLVGWLLMLCNCFVAMREDALRSMLDPQCQALLLPFAQLAAVSMQNAAAACSSSSNDKSSSSRGSSSSSSTASRPSSRRHPAGSSNSKSRRSRAGFSIGPAASVVTSVEDLYSWYALSADQASLTLLRLMVHWVSNDGHGGTEEAVKYMLQSNTAGAASLMRLLYMRIAWDVGAAHSKVQGRLPINTMNSSSRQQQGLEVPAYHEQYLAEIGAPAQPMHAEGPGTPRQAALPIAVVPLWLHEAAMQECSSSSSSSSSSGSAAAAQIGALDSSDLAAWNRLEMAAAIPTSGQLLLACEAAALSTHADVPCSEQAAHLLLATLQQLHERGSLTPAAAMRLLPPVLHLLGHGIVQRAATAAKSQSQQSTGSASGRAAPSETQHVHTAAMRYAKAVQLLLLAGISRQQVYDTVVVQPLAACRALELAIRASPVRDGRSIKLGIAAAGICYPLAKAAAEQALPLPLPNSQLFALAASCNKLGQAVAAAVASGDSNASSNDVTLRAVLACMPLTTLHAGAWLQQYQQQASSSAAAAAAAVRLSRQAATASNAADTAEGAACQGLLLAAQGMFAGGNSLTTLAGHLAPPSAASTADPEAAAAATAGQHTVLSLLAESLGMCQTATAMLQLSLPAARLLCSADVRGSMQQRVMQELQQLQQQVDAALTVLQAGSARAADPAAAADARGSNATTIGSADTASLTNCADAKDSSDSVDQNSSATTSSSRRDSSTVTDVHINRTPAAGLLPALHALLPALSQRLVACGDALAALCPVPLCCNNPGCAELRGPSEMHLVAGKGSVCSRCRTARYCSKACQVAHHPAHRKTCKGISASHGK